MKYMFTMYPHGKKAFIINYSSVTCLHLFVVTIIIIIIIMCLCLSQCLSKHHAMKAPAGVEIQFHAFLTSAPGGKWPASCSGCLPPGKELQYPLDKMFVRF
jgi:hypothetical protein